MTENEQIQEMSEMFESLCWDIPDDISEHCNIPCSECKAKYFYNKGYRKVERGEWIVDGLANPKCSLCRSYSPAKSNFCPNCGADMRGGDNEQHSEVSEEAR